MIFFLKKTYFSKEKIAIKIHICYLKIFEYKI
jgi:hypothetical protein